MEINRNQYFMVGIILVLLGLQVRMVDSYVLSEDATRFLAEHSSGTSSSTTTILALTPPQLTNKVIALPEWTGWCLISIGSVLILHSLALKGT